MMTRRCSLCSNNGHNSRTCPLSRSRSSATVKLFGVRLLADGSGSSIMKKSASMGNLTSSLSSCAVLSNHSSPSSHSSDGYVSDEPSTSRNNNNNHPPSRNKGIPWTEEEHRLFLIGLQKLGKGDWRGIARNFVVSRTPTQVASHAQKYFIRQSSATRRRRRSSLFDMVPNVASNSPSVPDEQVLLPPSENSQPSNEESRPSLNLSLKSEFEPMETISQENVEEHNETIMGSNAAKPVPPGFFPTYLPLPFPIWPPSAASFEEVNGTETSHHQVLKPIPVVPKEPVNVDEVVEMSQKHRYAIESLPCLT